MGVSLRSNVPADTLERHLSALMVIVSAPLPGAAVARLHLGANSDRPTLVLDPDIDDDEKIRALTEAFILANGGPDTTTSARLIHPRQLRLVR